jgi:hypothetical protein
MDHPRQSASGLHMLLQPGWHTVTMAGVPTLTVVVITVKHEENSTAARQFFKPSGGFLDVGT